MRHNVFAIAVCLLAIAARAAPKDPSLLAGEDVAVLRAIVRGYCEVDPARAIVVADRPDDASSVSLWEEWKLDASYSAQLIARSSQSTRWPPVTLCANARIESAERISAYFARDPRIPPGWETFEKEFGARGYIEVSRPAFSRDGHRALVVTSSHCGELCGHGHVIELRKTPDGWKVRRSFGTWIA